VPKGEPGLLDEIQRYELNYARMGRVNTVLVLIASGGVLRTCSRAPVDDCKTMAGTTYCYCKNDLCNNPSR